MVEVPDEIKKLFSSENPVFSGGFSLALVAVGAQALRSSYRTFFNIAKRNLLVTLEITSKDRSYPWVLQWLAAQGKNRPQHLSVDTIFKSAKTATGISREKLSFDLVPGPGHHFLTYQQNLLYIERVREQQIMDLNSGKPFEKILFTAFGRNTAIFDQILHESYKFSQKTEENTTIIYTNWGTEWRQFGLPRRKRILSSVVLDENVGEKILEDIEEWIESSSWYYNRGIPYRRGYLLHGPPGSGKSSFIFALAGHLGLNICILNLAERGLTDDRLAQALSCVPPHSIVLLEDIDAAFPSREDILDSKGGHSSDVTFSGLLNVLDGVSASEERLIFMTTNHIERLDPALIRPGRVDVVQLIGDATDFQIRSLFKRFYPESTTEEQEHFLSLLRKVRPVISMAALQGYFLRHKDSPFLAIEQVYTLINEDRPIQKPPTPATSSTSPGQNRQVKPRPVRILTAADVDRMVFNPQEGWDKDIK